MTKDCLYLDSKGQPAIEYYGNLHLGHNKALDAYVKKYKSIATTKFSKKARLSLTEVLEESEKLKSSSYKSQVTGNKAVSNSVLTNIFVEKIQDDVQLKNNALLKLVQRATIESLTASNKTNPSSLKKKLLDRFSTTPISVDPSFDAINFYKVFDSNLNEYDIIDNLEDFIQNLPVAHRTEFKNIVTEIYNLIPEFTTGAKSKMLQEEIKILKEEQERELQKGTHLESVLADFINKLQNNPNDAVDEIITDILYVKKGDHLNIRDRFVEVDTSAYKKLLADFYNKFYINYKNYKNVRFQTSFAVHAKDLSLRTDLEGLTPEDKAIIKDMQNGIIAEHDLVVLYQDDNGNDIMKTFDFKATTKKGYDNRHNNWAPLKGALSTVTPSRHGKYGLQQSLYNLAIKQVLPNVRIESSSILYFIGDITKSTQTVDGRLKNPSFQAEEKVANYSAKVRELFNIKSEHPQDGKIHVSSDVHKHLFGEKLGSNLNAIVDPDKAVDNKIKTIIKPRRAGEKYRVQVHGKKWLKADSENELIGLIKKYYKQDYDRLQGLMVNDFITFFNTGKKEWPNDYKGFNRVRQAQASAILNTFSPDTHTIEILRNIPGYENCDPNIVVLKSNTVTPEISLIYLTQDSGSEKLQLSDGTFLTNPLSHLGVKNVEYYKLTGDSKFKDPVYYSNKKDIRLLMAADLALQLALDGAGVVKTVTHGVLNNATKTTDVVSFTPSHTVPVSVLKDSLKIIYTHPKLSDHLNDHFKNIYTNPLVEHGTIFKTSVLQQIRDYLVNGDLDKMISPIYRKELEEYIKIHASSAGLVGDSFQDFKQFLTHLQAELASKSIGNNVSGLDAVANKEGVQLISKLIREINNIEYTQGEIVKKLTTMSAEASPNSRISNPVIQSFTAVITNTSTEIRQAQNAFNRQHNDILRRLYKKSNLASNVYLTMDQPTVFANMFLVNPNVEADVLKAIKEGRHNDLYRLKDPTDSSLSEVEKEYIEFFNKHIEKGFLKNVLKSRREAFKDRLIPGYVPLREASAENIAARETNYGTKIGKYFKSKFDRVLKKPHQTTEILTRLENRDLEQLGHIDNLQFSQSRRDMLGLDETGNMQGPYKEFLLETNLSTILADFTLEQNRIYANNNALALKDALNIELYLDNLSNKEATESTRAFLQKQVRLHIFKDYEEEKIAKIGDLAEKWTSPVVLAKFKQIALDASQGITGILGLTLSNLGSSSTSFINPKHLYSSVVTANSYEHREILGDLGLGFVEVELMDNKQFIYGRNSIYQSKNMFYANNYMYRMFSNSLYIAHLKTIGAYDAIKVSDSKTTYDVKEDKRFSGIFTNGGLKSDEQLSADEKKKKALYQFLVSELSKETDGIDANGLPTRPLSQADIRNLKEHNLKFFGSMDKDSKITGQLHFAVRAITKFKNFIPTKVTNYMQGTVQSSTRTEVIYNQDTGSFERKKMMTEGIVQTAMHIYRTSDITTYEKITMLLGAGTLLMKSSRKAEVLTTAQRENLRKLRADVILTAIILGIILAAKSAALEDEEAEKIKQREAKLLGVPYKKPNRAIVKERESLLQNVLGDVCTPALLYDAALGEGNMYVSGSVVVRFAKNALTSVYYLGSGDLEASAEAASKLTGLTSELYKFNKEHEYILPTLE